MVIYALSDMHGRLAEVPDCDLCIIAGDVCPIESHEVSFQADWLRDEFSVWLNRIPASHIVGIAGNHDVVIEHDPELPRTLPWTYLHDETATINGLKLYGTPYQRWFNHWPFMRTEEELEVLWKEMPASDIVICHGPPYGAGDVAGNGEWAGSKTLARKLQELQIPWCICGHIHENYGVYQLGPTQVANVAVVDNRYNVVHPPMRIHLDESR